jgi:hypothetical protein
MSVSCAISLRGDAAADTKDMAAAGGSKNQLPLIAQINSD